MLKKIDLKKVKKENMLDYDPEVKPMLEKPGKRVKKKLKKDRSKLQVRKDNPNSLYWKRKCDKAWGQYQHHFHRHCIVGQANDYTESVKLDKVPKNAQYVKFLSKAGSNHSYPINEENSYFILKPGTYEITTYSDDWSILDIKQDVIIGCNGPNNAHHLVSRGNVFLRHRIENCGMLCTNHHNYSTTCSPHAGPIGFTALLQKHYPDKYKWVIENQHKTGKPNYRESYHLLTEMLEQ